MTSTDLWSHGAYHNHRPIRLTQWRSTVRCHRGPRGRSDGHQSTLPLTISHHLEIGGPSIPYLILTNNGTIWLDQNHPTVSMLLYVCTFCALGLGSTMICQPCSNVDGGGEDNVISNNAASSTPIRSFLSWTTCKLLLPLLLLLLLVLSFTSAVIASSPLCCCCRGGGSFWSRPRSCLFFFLYRIPQALHRDWGRQWKLKELEEGDTKHQDIIYCLSSYPPCISSVQQKNWC